MCLVVILLLEIQCWIPIVVYVCAAICIVYFCCCRLNTKKRLCAKNVTVFCAGSFVTLETLCITLPKLIYIWKKTIYTCHKMIHVILKLKTNKTRLRLVSVTCIEVSVQLLDISTAFQDVWNQSRVFFS